MPEQNSTFDNILAGIQGDHLATEEYHNAAAEVTLEEDAQRDYAEEAENAELLANPDPGVDAASRIEQAQWAAANPELCTGRGPTGRLRNFPAMNDGKLLVTLDAVRREANDPEALDNLEAEVQHRGLA